MSDKRLKSIRAVILLSKVMYAAITLYYINRFDRQHRLGFRTYHYKAVVFESGLKSREAYLPSAALSLSLGLEYVYLPMTLWLFKILSLFDYNTAHYVYLALKCPALIFLIMIWKRYYLRDANRMLFHLLYLTGFKSAIPLT